VPNKKKVMNRKIDKERKKFAHDYVQLFCLLLI